MLTIPVIRPMSYEPIHCPPVMSRFILQDPQAAAIKTIELQDGYQSAYVMDATYRESQRVSGITRDIFNRILA